MAALQKVRNAGPIVVIALFLGLIGFIATDWTKVVEIFSMSSHNTIGSINGKDIINPYILKCGGTPIPDEDDDCWYWTSTEVEGQATAKAWLYSLGSGAIQETPKWQPHKARPIITIMD